MSAQDKDHARGLARLREPFPAHLVSKLPKAACRAEEWKKLPKGKCRECGGWHATTKTMHLSYVGHAALTDRLLDADPAWSWAPLATTPEGLPLFDDAGGLWIALTVCGVTRLGYGNAAAKSWGEPGNREKEIIGDALRNAAMRFGAALELWHKGTLRDDGAAPPTDEASDEATPGEVDYSVVPFVGELPDAIDAVWATTSLADFSRLMQELKAATHFDAGALAEIREAAHERRFELTGSNAD